MIIKYVCPNEIKYESKDASGVDLRSIENGIVPAKGTGFFNTGLKVSIPVGFEGQVRGRSGLARKKGIGITHGVGTIDADYRGEIGIMLCNWSDEDFVVTVGDRIAQLVIMPVVRAEFVLEEELLDITSRNADGFGSTGIK